MEKKIQQLFCANGGILRTEQLTSAGVYYRKLQALLKSGEIAPITRGFYQLESEQKFSDLPLLLAMFPDGILCMESALMLYGYTERTPAEWHIAVDHKTARKRFAIDYPFVKPHFITSDKFPIGISTSEADGCQVQVYDRERTICDVLYHKNKLDAEVFHFAIQSYVKDSQKNPANLIPYAKQLRVEGKVREVLGVWL